MAEPYIHIENLNIGYGDVLIQENLNFTVNKGDIFIIMGGSGCGKSTLLKVMTGLNAPQQGTIHYQNLSLWDLSDDEKDNLMRNIGVMYQSGALWSSMTLAENVALPLQEYTDLANPEIYDIACYKLALVGLYGFEDHYPYEISGGMCKRVGLARAMALDPDVLFFDEPSAGLDPISAKQLDELILQLRHSLNATFVVVTHELASIFTIGNNAIFLDNETKTLIAQGSPKALKQSCDHPKVKQFLNRGAS